MERLRRALGRAWHWLGEAGLWVSPTWGLGPLTFGDDLLYRGVASDLEGQLSPLWLFAEDAKAPADPAGQPGLTRASIEAARAREWLAGPGLAAGERAGVTRAGLDRVCARCAVLLGPYAELTYASPQAGGYWVHCARPDCRVCGMEV